MMATSRRQQDLRRVTRVVLSMLYLLLAGICFAHPARAQTLENPQPGSSQSGIGVITGWACDANEIEIQFNNDAATLQPAGYGTQRLDTQSVCGDADNGYGLLFNWNRLGDGTHTVQALADGVEFADVSITVITLGENFLRDAEGEVTIDHFPTRDSAVTLRWQEAQQNFAIAHANIQEATGGTDNGGTDNGGMATLKEGMYLLSGFGWSVYAQHPPVLHAGELKTPNMAGELTVRCDFTMYSAYPPPISETGRAHLKEVLEACFGAAKEDTQDATFVHGDASLERVIQYEDGSHHWERALYPAVDYGWCEKGRLNYTNVRPPVKPCLKADGHGTAISRAPAAPDWFDWDSVSYDGAEVVWIKISMATTAEAPYAWSTCGGTLWRSESCPGLFRSDLRKAWKGGEASVWVTAQDPVGCNYEPSRNACASANPPAQFFEWPPFFTTEKKGTDYVARVLRPLAEKINGHPTAGWWTNTHSNPSRMIQEEVVKAGETRDDNIIINGTRMPSRGPMKVLTDGMKVGWGGEIAHARETGCGAGETCGWGDPYSVRPGFVVYPAVPFHAIPKFRTCTFDNPAYPPGHEYYRWHFSNVLGWEGNHCEGN